jgi:hypothetical protein
MRQAAYPQSPYFQQSCQRWWRAADAVVDLHLIVRDQIEAAPEQT